MKRVTPLFKKATLVNGYLLGVMLGFIPCGLVFAALMAVSATADPMKALVGMLAFGLGTMPALIAVALGGRALFRVRPVWVKPAFTALMIFNSLLLFVMAGKGLV
jgi:sulfite exporter TauE/SafE